MLRAIEASKQRPLSRLLFGLNIRYAGGKTAQIIARAFGNMDRLQAASEEEDVSVPGIGPKAGQRILSWLQDEQKRAMNKRFQKDGGKNIEEKKTTTRPLAGPKLIFRN